MYCGVKLGAGCCIYSVPLQLLVLLVVAALVRSDPGSGYSIETGPLKSLEMKLSNGANQEAWWPLGVDLWHDCATTRFFAAGPLKADEMQALAAQNQNSDSWTASKIKSTEPYTNLTQALQRISTATYRLDNFIAGTGKIEASMWTLLFKCLGTNCSEGYLVPIVVLPKVAATADRSTDNSAYVYATVWLPVTSSLLVNAVPSFIFGLLPEASPLPISLIDASDGISLHLNVRDHGLSSCPRTAVADCRTLLDGAYGLLPNTVCIRLNRSTSVDYVPFNLLVSIPGSFSGSNGSNTDYLPPSVEGVEGFLSGLGVTNLSWVLQPFETCSQEPVLMPSLVNDSFMVCYKASCKGVLPTSVSCGSSSDQAGILLLKSMSAYMKASPECKSTVQLDSYNVSCQFSATSETCAFSAFQNSSMVMLSPSSRWTSTKGLDTTEFQNSFDSYPIAAGIGEHALCTVEEPSIPLDVRHITTAKGSVPTDIRIRARAYLAGYIAEHNIAFNTCRGPPTDLYTFIALIVSTALSVILAISGSFTNFLLREICKRLPLYLDNESGRKEISQVALKMCVQVGCNVALSMVSFLPVLSVAWNELQREMPFYTWDLGSSDLDAFDPSQESDRLRAIFFLSAVSQYDSHFLTAIAFVLCVTCFIVAASTARRCIQIFRRYRLLKDYDMKTGASAGEVHRALSAIEMTEAQYVKISDHMGRRDQRPLIN